MAEKKAKKKPAAKKAAPKKAVKKAAPKKEVAKKAAPKKEVAKKAPKKAAKAKSGAAPIRYTEAKKQQILAFVKKVNEKTKKGGMAEAARKFGMQPLTIARWIKKYGL